MAPTNIAEGIGRLELIYARGGYPMTTNLFVDAVEVSGVWKLENAAGSTRYTIDEFWDGALKTKFLELFPITMSMSQIRLWTYNEGAWVPRASQVETEAGTGENSPGQCGVMTVTYRDVNNKYVRMEFFEPDGVPPSSLKHGDNWPDIDTFTADVIAGTPTGTNIGSFVLSRSAHSITSVINWSIKISDRLRRERGFI
jgi:hypothetical protein